MTNITEVIVMQKIYRSCKTLSEFWAKNSDQHHWQLIMEHILLLN